MKRENFVKIIKLRSDRKISKKLGNYVLPGGKLLSDYVEDLVRSQMKLDVLAIREDGNLDGCTGGGWNAANGCFDDYTILSGDNQTETCSYDDMQRRIRDLVLEIIIK